MSHVIEPAAPRVLPELDERTRPFWTGGRDGRLLILKDRNTGRWIHPPERVPEGADGLVAEPVSGKGAVFTFTVNHQPYHPDVPVPYVIALVELDEQAGLRLPANIVNCDIDAVHIGMRVRVLFEGHGEVYVPVFEPDPAR
ncbi:MAG: Zn-ribbon domain-containing OB-fold protein [Pseudomonadota bacterium]